MMGHPPRFMLEIKVTKDEKMFYSIGCFIIGSLAVISIAYLYLKRMSDEMLK
jgi:hypothetical protein